MTPDNQNQFWWRQSKLFDIREVSTKKRTVTLRTHPQPQGDFWFNHFWKPNEVAAWAYELVRHWKFCPKSIPETDRKWIERFPPYPSLSPMQRRCLRAALPPETLVAVLVQAAKSTAPIREGFSETIPRWQFNLRAPATQVKDLLMKWWQAQRQARGISDKIVVKGTSRNPDQSYKLGDWSLVEILAEPQTKDNKTRRLYAIEQAKKYCPYAKFAITMAKHPQAWIIPERPLPTSEFGDKIFTEEEVIRAVQKAKNRPSALFL